MTMVAMLLLLRMLLKRSAKHPSVLRCLPVECQVRLESHIDCLGASHLKRQKNSPFGVFVLFEAASAYDDDDDDDDEVVGPALPGMKGFRVADERVEAEMARRALELEQAEWDRARGVAGDTATKEENASQTRQEWMTVMPESSFFKDSLAPANRGPPGKPAAFRRYETSDHLDRMISIPLKCGPCRLFLCLLFLGSSKEPAAVDHTWFDAPEERDRARRAKLDMCVAFYLFSIRFASVGP